MNVQGSSPTYSEAVEESSLQHTIDNLPLHLEPRQEVKELEQRYGLNGACGLNLQRHNSHKTPLEVWKWLRGSMGKQRGSMGEHRESSVAKRALAREQSSEA